MERPHQRNTSLTPVTVTMHCPECGCRYAAGAISEEVAKALVEAHIIASPTHDFGRLDISGNYTGTNEWN